MQNVFFQIITVDWQLDEVKSISYYEFILCYLIPVVNNRGSFSDVL